METHGHKQPLARCLLVRIPPYKTLANLNFLTRDMAKRFDWIRKMTSLPITALERKMRDLQKTNMAAPV